MTGATRAEAIPDIPTVAESGVKDYEAGSWYGILAPAGTPRPIVDRLNREIVAAVKSREIQDRLLSEAVIPVGSTPEAFAEHISKELARAAKVVKESGAKFKLASTNRQCQHERVSAKSTELLDRTRRGAHELGCHRARASACYLTIPTASSS